MILWACTMLAILAVLCRFVPGPKCITYCKFKKSKYEKAWTRFNRYIAIHCHNHAQIVTTDFSSLLLKDLVRLYEETEPYGCQSFSPDYTEWKLKARNQLKEAIAERQLLDIK